MNNVKLDKIKNDRYDIDNYLMTQIKKEKYITKHTYNRFINYSVMPNNLIKKRNVSIFYDQIKKLYIKYPKLSLPWNLAYPSTSIRYNLVIIPDNPYLFKLELSRLFNWIESALKFKFLNKLIHRSQSSRGQHSPATKIDLWELSNFGSPGFVNYKLQLMYYRVNYYLKLISPLINMPFYMFATYLSIIIYNGRKLNLHKISINKYAIKIAVYFMRYDINNYENNLSLRFEFTDMQYDILMKIYDRDIPLILGYRNSVDYLITLIKLKNNDPEILLTYM